MAPKDVTLRELFEALGSGHLYDYLEEEETIETAGTLKYDFDATVVISGRIQTNDKKQARKIIKYLLDAKVKGYPITHIGRINIRRVKQKLAG